MISLDPLLDTFCTTFFSTFLSALFSTLIHREVDPVLVFDSVLWSKIMQIRQRKQQAYVIYLL